MSKIRVGMVGYGFRGAGLWGMCPSVEQLDPVAICDANAEVKDKISADFPQAKYYDNYEAMLDSGTIDAVFVEVPPKGHVACTIAALQRGIHVLSDVPVLHDLEDVDKLWQVSQKSDAVFMLGATSNFWGFVETCSDLKRKGLLGKPFYLEAEYIHDIREFAKLTPWRQGYEPIRYCTHSLGPVLEWLDDEFVSVSCMSTGSQMQPGEAGDDAMVAIMRTGDNVVVKLLLSFANSLSHGVHKFVVHGTEGYFECTWPLTGAEPVAQFSTKKLYGLDKMTTLPVSSVRAELANIENVSGHGPADYATLVEFAEAINGGVCRFDLKQGLRMTLPGMYALESARQGGQLVEIKYPWK